jgi:hypothetical protein
MKTESKNIFCSVSAGYSSVMMAVKLREWFPDHSIINVMANTSKETPESLEFMHECDIYYGLNLKWIEAIINPIKGKGTNFKIANFKDLELKGKIFEDGIKVYGIPSQVNKWCNRELKLIPLGKYADSVFGKNDYSIAVGIRVDEFDRVRKDYKTNNVFYPLIDNEIDTKARNLFWSKQPIQIKTPAFKGNCDLCFEKSNRKLMTILSEEPKTGDWWQDMVNKYGKIEKPTSPSYNDLLKKNGRITFYRGYQDINDLVKQAQYPFSKASDEYVYESDLLDLEGDCGSGCQVF